MDRSTAENINLNKQLEMLREQCQVLSWEKANMANLYESLQSTNKSQAADLRRARTNFKDLDEENRTQAAEITLLITEKDELSEAVADLETSIQFQDAQAQRSKSKIEALMDENKGMAEKLRKVEGGWMVVKSILDAEV
jgi:chromosome segregation ATPase